MFKRKKKQVDFPPSYTLRLSDMERRIMSMMREFEDLRQKINLIKLTENDLKSVDVLSVMMGEVVRRVDLAGIANLPNECKCEACGCDDVTIPSLESIEELDAYCVKCRDKRTIKKMVIKTSDSGRRMATGNCSVCNTKVTRILGKGKK